MKILKHRVVKMLFFVAIFLSLVGCSEKAVPVISLVASSSIADDGKIEALNNAASEEQILEAMLSILTTEINEPIVFSFEINESIDESDESLLESEIEDDTFLIEHTSEPETAVIRQLTPDEYRELRPNEIGEIMIVMYHGIIHNAPSNDYHRNVDDFKDDLQQMYDRGYRLVPIRDLIENNITVSAGFSPIVLTFDDGLPSAFSFEEIDGELVPKKDTAVDIINKFAEENPDFGRAAVFYINGDSRNVPFNGAGTLAERFDYLIENGYEIGNHTFNHLQMSRLDSEQIQQELALIQKLVTDHIGHYEIQSLAYPFGLRPKEDIRHFALSGSSEGVSYNHKWALNVGQSGRSSAPNNVRFDPLNIPRVRSTNYAVTDLGWSFTHYDQNPHLKYISDGDPGKISVPSDQIAKLDKDTLGDKILYIYDVEDEVEMTYSDE